jgi:hypothetical protein
VTQKGFLRKCVLALGSTQPDAEVQFFATRAKDLSFEYVVNLTGSEGLALRAVCLSTVRSGDAGVSKSCCVVVLCAMLFNLN